MGTSADTGGAKWFPLSGLAAVVLVVVAFAGLGSDTPGAEDSAATISAYYDSHEVREMLAAFVLAASAPLFVIFAIWLAASLWPSDSLPRPIWHTVLGVGGAVAAGGFLAAALIHVALAQTANANDVGAGGLQALAGLDESSWVAFNAGLGVMMLGAAGSLRATRAHPVLAWIALIAGIALFIPFADFFALMVSGLWIIWTSIALFRRGPAFSVAMAT